MGVAVASLPLAGCTLFESEQYRAQAKAPSDIVVSADEAALYEQARASGNVTLADEFLRAYPSSELIRSLLTRLPHSTLRRIDRKYVNALSPSLVQTLPADVKQSLGIISARGGDRSDRSSDGYSG